MAFPQPFLDALTERNPIDEVVGQYVSLTRRGSNLFGLCPFHSEKTASFSVAPDKGIFYCFGCHAGGGVINFIMQIEGLDYPDAVRFLAKRAGLEVPEDENYHSQYQKQERLWALCKDAARFFRQQLFSPVGTEAQAYIQKRALSMETVKRFGLGFSPNAWASLTDAMKEKGYKLDELIDAGLALRGKNGGVYDRFRNRLMFPIIDIRNNIIGFGGRVMDDSTPKYLNSPETIIFNKRKNLFALNIARKSKQGRIILTEGYMDAIALHQYGFDCAVASLGTSLTEEHANILAKYTNQVILTYDGDEAGQNATRRAIPMLEKTGIQVRVLRMQGAKDPDEFLKKYGAQRFEVLLDACQNQAEYRLDSLKRKYDLTLDDQRVEFLNQAAALIATFPNAVQREVYGRRAAEAAGITPEAMQLEIKKAYRKARAIEQKKQESQDLDIARQRAPKSRAIRYDNLRSASAEEGLICMLLREPELIASVTLPAEAFSVDLFGRVLADLRQRMQAGRPTALSALEADFTPEEMAHLSYIMSRDTAPVSDEAFADYLRVIQEEYEDRSLTRSEDSLRLLAEQIKSTKQYGG